MAVRSYLVDVDGNDRYWRSLCSPRIRLYLGLAITFAVMPAIPAVPQDIQLLSFRGFMTIAEQMIIGVAMGMVTQFMIQTFVLLGQILGMQSSLGFASMVDPANGQNTPLLGQLFMFLTTMFFLATDGHLKMLQLVVFSFKTLPIGSGTLTAVDFRDMAGWLGIMFKTALSMSLSGIIALLTINLSFGVNDACRASTEHFLARLCVCIDGGSIDLLVHLGWSIQSL